MHLFKDSKNLEEYELFFLNETSEEITKFYLEIAEQEFLPIDIEIDGLRSKYEALKIDRTWYLQDYRGQIELKESPRDHLYLLRYNAILYRYSTSIQVIRSSWIHVMNGMV